MPVCGITALAVPDTSQQTDAAPQGPRPLCREDWHRFKGWMGRGKSVSEQPKHSSETSPKTPVFCTLTQCCQLSLTKIPFLEKPLKPCFVRMCQLKTIFKFWNPSPPPYGRCVNTQDNSTAGIQYALLYLRLHIQDCLIQRQYTRQ